MSIDSRCDRKRRDAETSKPGQSIRHNMKKEVTAMAEVARYQLGETTIIVYDDAYKGKTKEDIDAVLRQAAAVAERHTRIPKEVRDNALSHA